MPLKYDYNRHETLINASIPLQLLALMCYNNHVVGPRVILDVFRAKESSTTNWECTVTSDKPTKFNLSTYNNYHPGPGCGSLLLFTVNGNFAPGICYVVDMQLPSSNLTGTFSGHQNQRSTLDHKYRLLCTDWVRYSLTVSLNTLKNRHLYI